MGKLSVTVVIPVLSSPHLRLVGWQSGEESACVFFLAAHSGSYYREKYGRNRKTPWGCSKSNRLMKDSTTFTKRSKQPERVLVWSSCIKQGSNLPTQYNTIPYTHRGYQNPQKVKSFEICASILFLTKRNFCLTL